MSINRKVLITKFIDGKIYSSSILKRIRSIIGSPNSYNKANNKKKTQIYNKLKELSLLKNYLELFNYEKNGYLTESYPDQFIIFSDILKNVLNSNIKRVDSSLMKNQLILSFKETISFLLKNGFIETEYDPSSFLDEIKIDIIFTILLDSAFSSFKYVFDEMQFSITIMFRNGYVNIYNTTTYISSFTELSQIIDILNDEKSFPSSNLIANIRKYKLNQIINTI